MLKKTTISAVNCFVRERESFFSISGFPVPQVPGAIFQSWMVIFGVQTGWLVVMDWALILALPVENRLVKKIIKRLRFMLTSRIYVGTTIKILWAQKL